MEIFYIALLTLIAATVGTITGFGTSTLMIPVLAKFFPPVEAIFLVAIIHWFGDVWKVTLFRKGFNVWSAVFTMPMIRLRSPQVKNGRKSAKHGAGSIKVAISRSRLMPRKIMGRKVEYKYPYFTFRAESEIWRYQLTLQ